MIHVAEYDDQGHMKRYERYFDASIARTGSLPIIMSMPNQRIVISADTLAEKQNG